MVVPILLVLHFKQVRFNLVERLGLTKDWVKSSSWEKTLPLQSLSCLNCCWDTDVITVREMGQKVLRKGFYLRYRECFSRKPTLEALGKPRSGLMQLSHCNRYLGEAKKWTSEEPTWGKPEHHNDKQETKAEFAGSGIFSDCMIYTQLWVEQTTLRCSH